MDAYESINKILVHLFNDIWELEEKAVITEEFKDLTNNDMHIIEAIQTILSICGGISIIGGAAAVIFKWITPAFRLNKRVETLEEHDRRVYESLRRIAERDSLILEVLSTMLDSQISGNNVEELKKTKQKLTNYLAQNQR